MEGHDLIDPVWEEGDDYLHAKAEELRELSESVLASLENQAMALREWFREERKEMQRAAKERAENPKGEPDGEKVGYAPINIFVKSRNGSMEIYWQEVHVTAKKSMARRYVYLPRGKSFSYSEHRLRSSAKPFETELVLATEKRAAQLREWWSIWSNIRRTQKNIVKVSRAKKVVKKPESAKGTPELVPVMENQG